MGENATDSLLSIAQLLALLDSAAKLTAKISSSELLEHILGVASSLTNAQAASVILRDPDRGDLYFAAATGPTAEKARQFRMPIGQGKAGQVYATRQPLLENKVEDNYKPAEEFTQLETRSMICVPLTFADAIYGVLQLINKDEGRGRFSEADLELTLRFASQAALAIRNKTLFDRMLASSGLYGLPAVRDDLANRLSEADTRVTLEPCSILFADMRGFSQLCHLLASPQHIHSRLAEFLGMLAHNVITHQGIVNKFLGDGIMAIFRGKRSAENALLAAFAMKEAFAKILVAWKLQSNDNLVFLDIGIGIATDDVILGMTGNESVSDFTVIGSPVNLAAALQRDARGGVQVLCDNVTFMNARQIIRRFNGPRHYEIIRSEQRVFHPYVVYAINEVDTGNRRIAFFISQAPEDAATVRETIAAPLEAAGHEVFSAPRGDSTGRMWEGLISQAMETCDIFIVAVSKAAAQSPSVALELSHVLTARNFTGKVLPVLLDDTAPVALNQRLAGVPSEDVRTPESRAKFFHRIRTLVARSDDTVGAEKIMTGA